MTPSVTSDLGVPRLLWTDEQTAGALGVTVNTVEGLHRTGQLVGLKVGRHLRWRPSDVVAFVERLIPRED